MLDQTNKIKKDKMRPVLENFKIADIIFPTNKQKIWITHTFFKFSKYEKDLKIHFYFLSVYCPKHGYRGTFLRLDGAYINYEYKYGWMTSKQNLIECINN